MGGSPSEISGLVRPGYSKPMDLVKLVLALDDKSSDIKLGKTSSGRLSQVLRGISLPCRFGYPQISLQKIQILPSFCK